MSDMILDKRKKAHSATTHLLHLPLFQKCQQRNKYYFISQERRFFYYFIRI